MQRRGPLPGRQLSVVLEWPIGRLLGGVTVGQRGALGTVFVCL